MQYLHQAASLFHALNRIFALYVKDNKLYFIFDDNFIMGIMNHGILKNTIMVNFMKKAS